LIPPSPPPNATTPQRLAANDNFLGVFMVSRRLDFVNVRLVKIWLKFGLNFDGLVTREGENQKLDFSRFTNLTSCLMDQNHTFRQNVTLRRAEMFPPHFQL
jgi:hypothetical protein